MHGVKLHTILGTGSAMLFYEGRPYASPNQKTRPQKCTQKRNGWTHTQTSASSDTLTVGAARFTSRRDDGGGDGLATPGPAQFTGSSVSLPSSSRDGSATPGPAQFIGSSVSLPSSSRDGSAAPGSAQFIGSSVSLPSSSRDGSAAPGSAHSLAAGAFAPGSTGSGCLCCLTHHAMVVHRQHGGHVGQEPDKDDVALVCAEERLRLDAGVLHLGGARKPM